MWVLKKRIDLKTDIDLLLHIQTYSFSFTPMCELIYNNRFFEKYETNSINYFTVWHIRSFFGFFGRITWNIFIDIISNNIKTINSSCMLVKSIQWTDGWNQL